MFKRFFSVLAYSKPANLNPFGLALHMIGYVLAISLLTITSTPFILLGYIIKAIVYGCYFICVKKNLRKSFGQFSVTRLVCGEVDSDNREFCPRSPEIDPKTNN